MERTEIHDQVKGQSDCQVLANHYASYFENLSNTQKTEFISRLPHRWQVRFRKTQNPFCILSSIVPEPKEQENFPYLMNEFIPMIGKPYFPLVFNPSELFENWDIATLRSINYIQDKNEWYPPIKELKD